MSFFLLTKKRKIVIIKRTSRILREKHILGKEPYLMPKTAAIIAEYNPFHNGHAYQIEETKKRTGADRVLVIMSGDFVQRGTPAIFDKYVRTRMALLGGADVVLELPVFYAGASAEYFARGAVRILDALNVVDFLSFGSEDGDISLLSKAARFLSQESGAFQVQLKKGLKKGLPFPVARKEALGTALTSDPFLSPVADRLQVLLDTPNNILAIEYCKALFSMKSRISPLTIKRQGSAYHDTGLTHSLSSASALRKVLLSPKTWDTRIQEIGLHQPAPVFSYMQDILTHYPPITEEDFSLVLKYSLMRQNRDTLCTLSDVSPELSNRIYKNLDRFCSFSQFAALLKTRDITLTRVNRCLLHSLLSITQEEPAAQPSYVRLLGFRKNAAPLLRQIQDSSRIPLITKAADHPRLLSPQACTFFEKDLFASDLYETVLKNKLQEDFVSDLRKSPVILSPC